MKTGLYLRAKLITPVSWPVMGGSMDEVSIEVDGNVLDAQALLSSSPEVCQRYADTFGVAKVKGVISLLLKQPFGSSQIWQGALSQVGDEHVLDLRAPRLCFDRIV